MNMESVKRKKAERVPVAGSGHFVRRAEVQLNSRKADFWDELTPEQKQEIKSGLQELDQGKRILLEDLMAKTMT